MRLDLSLATPEYVSVKRQEEINRTGVLTTFMRDSFDKSSVVCYIREETKWLINPIRISISSKRIQIDIDGPINRERLDWLNRAILVHEGNEYRLDSIDVDSETYEMYDQSHTERWLEITFERVTA